MSFKNFRDIEVDELTKEEKDLIRFFRNMNGQHGTFYAKNYVEFTDGVATTFLRSEDEFMIDIFAKILHWEDDDYINYLCKRTSKKLDTFE